MAVVRRTLVISAGTLLAAAAVILPASMSRAAERTPMLSYDFTGMAPFAATTQDAAAETPATVHAAAQIDDESLDCLAKVVHHEAGNQSRTGQVAVAQTLINRLKAGGRFGTTICAVANQRGQYFNTAAYRPREDETWDEAVDVARDTLNGEEAAVVPGAMFFRAAYSPQNNFFRSRQRVAAVGDHVFYR